MNHCELCGKAIKNNDARFGDDCQKRYVNALRLIETTEKEMADLFSSLNRSVIYWRDKLSQALIVALKRKGMARARAYRDAREFLHQARATAYQPTNQLIGRAA
jgi:hypothetical protein